MNDVLSYGNRIQQNAFNLLLNMNNNAVECYNTVLAKFTGGKRINFGINNSYNLRCRAVVLQFNENKNSISKSHKKMTTRSLGKFKKFYFEKAKKNV